MILQSLDIDKIADNIINSVPDFKWQVFIKRQGQWEKRFKVLLIKLFNEQEKEVLANMKRYPKSVWKGWLSDWLFAEMLWRKRFRNESKPFIGGVLEDVGTSELGNLVTGINFDVNNPRVTEFLNVYIPKFSFEVNKEKL